MAHARGTTAPGVHAAAGSAHADDPRLRAPLLSPAPGLVAEAPSAAGFGEEQTHDAAAALRGTAVHRLLQLLASDPAIDEPPLRARLQTRLRKAVADGDFRDWLAEARAVLAAPALAHLYDPLRLRRAWNEVPVIDGDRGGIIDRLVDDGDTLWIADYKTAAQADAATLIERYRPQLRAYADQVAKLWPGRALRAGLVLTAAASWVEVPLTAR
jgi:ATP-dependent helicase/nuclease subunit A